MNLDDVVLSFTPGTLTILNVVLGLIMFGIALDTSPSDFRVVASHQESLHSHDAVSLLTVGETFRQASLDPRLFDTLRHAG